MLQLSQSHAQKLTIYSWNEVGLGGRQSRSSSTTFHMACALITLFFSEYVMATHSEHPPNPYFIITAIRRYDWETMKVILGYCGCWSFTVLLVTL